MGANGAERVCPSFHSHHHHLTRTSLSFLHAQTRTPLSPSLMSLPALEVNAMAETYIEDEQLLPAAGGRDMNIDFLIIYIINMEPRSCNSERFT
jgi:hypothetical protein